MVHSLRAVKKLKDAFYVRKKYIKHGYRAHPHMTFEKCTKSIFMLHNETFNIWSHLLCAFFYLYQLLLLSVNSTPYSQFEKPSSRVI